MRNASDLSKVKMSSSEDERKLRKKLFVNTYEISSIKRVTRKVQQRQKCRSKYTARAKSLPSPLHCILINTVYFLLFKRYNISQIWHFNSLCKNDSRGLLVDYFSRKSASPSTVSNVKHRIEKFLHSGFKFFFFFSVWVNYKFLYESLVFRLA